MRTFCLLAVAACAADLAPPGIAAPPELAYGLTESDTAAGDTGAPADTLGGPTPLRVSMVLRGFPDGNTAPPYERCDAVLTLWTFEGGTVYGIGGCEFVDDLAEYGGMTVEITGDRTGGPARVTFLGRDWSTDWSGRAPAGELASEVPTYWTGSWGPLRR